jgi:hypothetical protein
VHEERTLDLSLQPSFQFWIKRTEDATAPFALRFEVRDGKGLLRVAHPDVLLDPPASRTGLQEGLDAEVVRASRFLLIAEAGKVRKGFFLAALGEDILDRLPLGLWVELLPRVAGDMRLLTPPARLPEGVESDPEASVGDEDELVTNPGEEPRSQRDRIREVIHSYDRVEAGTDATDAPVVRERSWDEGDISLFDFDNEHTDPSIGGDTIFIGGTEDEARALVGDALLAAASMFDAPPLPEFDDDEDEAEEGTLLGDEGEADERALADDDRSAMATLVDEEQEPGLSGDPMPRIALTQLPIGAPRTALVRHLRRSAQRDQQRLERLEARVAELEEQLRAARKALSER